MTKKDLYWRKMYDELEVQMKDMMHTTLHLLENYKNNGWGAKYESLQNENKRMKKELHQLKLLEHRFKVTYLGRITLKYLKFKSQIKTKLKK